MGQGLFKTAQVTGLEANVERQPIFSSRGVVGCMRGSGSCETRVRGTLADVMGLLGYLTKLPGSQNEWCDVTLTVEGDEQLIEEFARRVHAFAFGKPAVADGSRADGRDG